MKAILISIRPQHTCNILNGIKLWEIRKRFPKDYVGWVYIYCTKDKNRLVWDIDGHICVDNEHYAYGDEELNGKVVARFWCDKVEEINYHPYEQTYYTKTLDTVIWKGHEPTLLKVCCLSWEELDNYLKEKKGYAIHITKLEIFDKPKEISEFVPYNIKQDHYKPFPTCDFRLTRAPESYCYIEI